MNQTRKKKRLTTEEFNLIYELLRESSNTPQVKPRVGQTFSQETWRIKE
jgi:hypothetical protein